MAMLTGPAADCGRGAGAQLHRQGPWPGLFRGSGVWVQGFGFRGMGLGFLGFRVWGSFNPKAKNSPKAF